jgi:fermentation-respiration switch protein FrsA (DUF1100 family)
VDALAPVDAVHFVGQAAPAKLLFQFAKRDEFITRWDAEAYLLAAGDSREVKWYDTDHFFNDEARRDRGEWLGRVLDSPNQRAGKRERESPLTRGSRCLCTHGSEDRE